MEKQVGIFNENWVELHSLDLREHAVEMHQAYGEMGAAVNVIGPNFLWLFEYCGEFANTNPISLMMEHAELLAEWNTLVDTCVADETLERIGWECGSKFLIDVPKL